MKKLKKNGIALAGLPKEAYYLFLHNNNPRVYLDRLHKSKYKNNLKIRIFNHNI